VIIFDQRYLTPQCADVVAGPGDGSLDFSAMLAKPEGLVQAKYMMKVR